MGKPKKRTTPRRTGNRRSHLVSKLAKAVNAKSPVKVRKIKPETEQPVKKSVKKPAPKKVAKA